MNYTKLFHSILDSSIWQEAPETKILWITLLAMTDRYGQVHASIPGLSVRAGISIEKVKSSLVILISPDPYSRTREHEGRRIAEIDGGWELLNHEKYRQLLSAEERREYNTRKQRERRAKLSNNVNKCQQMSAMSTHTDADSKAKVDSDSDSETTTHARTGTTQTPQHAESQDIFSESKEEKPINPEQALAPWVRTRTQDSDTTADNYGEIRALVGIHGMLVVQKKAEQLAYSNGGKIWPSMLSEAFLRADVNHGKPPTINLPKRKKS